MRNLSGLSVGPVSAPGMAWEFRCPIEGCEFADSDDDQLQLVENARQHMADKHGNTATRDEVEQYVVGPG